MKEIAALLPQITILERQYRIPVANLLTEVRGKAVIRVAFCESIVKENGVTAVCSMHQEMRCTKFFFLVARAQIGLRIRLFEVSRSRTNSQK